MMNFAGQFCSRLLPEGLVMMENRPTVTKIDGLESLAKITFLTNHEIGKADSTTGQSRCG
jgi:hypothetical protein